METNKYDLNNKPLLEDILRAFDALLNEGGFKNLYPAKSKKLKELFDKIKINAA